MIWTNPSFLWLLFAVCMLSVFFAEPIKEKEARRARGRVPQAKYTKAKKPKKAKGTKKKKPKKLKGTKKQKRYTPPPLSPEEQRLFDVYKMGQKWKKSGTEDYTWSNGIPL